MRLFGLIHAVPSGQPATLGGNSNRSPWRCIERRASPEASRRGLGTGRSGAGAGACMAKRIGWRLNWRRIGTTKSRGERTFCLMHSGAQNSSHRMISFKTLRILPPLFSTLGVGSTPEKYFQSLLVMKYAVWGFWATKLRNESVSKFSVLPKIVFGAWSARLGLKLDVTKGISLLMHSWILTWLSSPGISNNKYRFPQPAKTLAASRISCSV